MKNHRLGLNSRINSVEIYGRAKDTYFPKWNLIKVFNPDESASLNEFMYDHPEDFDGKDMIIANSFLQEKRLAVAS